MEVFVAAVCVLVSLRLVSPGVKMGVIAFYADDASGCLTPQWHFPVLDEGGTNSSGPADRGANYYTPNPVDRVSLSPSLSVSVSLSLSLSLSLCSLLVSLSCCDLAFSLSPPLSLPYSLYIELLLQWWLLLRCSVCAFRCVSVSCLLYLQFVCEGSVVNVSLLCSLQRRAAMIL